MIKSLRLKGFRRYVDETLAFEPGVCFVSGRNNAGKTSLFLAVEYALFGARSPAALMRPGTTSMGVELVFVGREGKTYKLQRVHAKPPRARSRIDGHFTLKEVGDSGESYLLSSDFQDHEEQLARKLVEITGISRRVFELAVHVRQGEIAAILDGDSKLDIALGITAAGTADEEMRALALLDERAAESLPALRASRKHIAEEKAAAGAGEGALAKEIAKLRKAIEDHEEALRGAGADPTLAALEERVDVLAPAVLAWGAAHAALARAAAALAAVGVDDADLRAQAAALEEKRAALAGSAGAVDAADLRGDLRGRIARASAELSSGEPTCHCCGAPLARAALEELVAQWKRELVDVDATLASRDAGARAVADEARALEAARARLAAARQAHAAAEVEEREAGEAAAARLAAAGGHAEDTLAGAQAALAEAEAAFEDARMAHAQRTAKAEALLENASDALHDAEERLDAHNQRAARLEREEARLAVAVDNLEKRAARAEELRALSAAFKALQEELREKAAHELAEATLRIHRAISVDDELAAVRIDPARYQVLVTARDHGAEAPASLAQGGGHRLLLGLAFRLALVERLGPFPFALLDEPTYGLDDKNRAALLERIAGLRLSPQIILITHQAMGDVAGQRIDIERPEQDARGEEEARA